VTLGRLPVEQIRPGFVQYSREYPYISGKFLELVSLAGVAALIRLRALTA
jgi:hypothetical protein